ncbi:MAG: hypothetical protein WAZ18_05480 [Alphaproteobacteria bacterium]
MSREMPMQDTALQAGGRPTWRPSSAVAKWFEGKGLDELAVIEHGGKVLYPETLKRRVVKTGQHEEVAVLVMVPGTRERVVSRVDAVRWACQLLGKDAPERHTIAEVESRIGEVYWQHIDNVCLLSHCVFEAGATPPRRYALPEVLDGLHPSGALYDLLERLDWWATQEDPRVQEAQLDEETVLEVAAAIARREHTGPLLAIDGRARERCITTMARLLVTSRTPKSSSPSPATSTPA